ncbi:Sucrase-isomaltase, intestinal [Amphibalanus amphitrite]|uniref:Sucrase-isomaltase, intestinal n=1 Tax=Amphibalanus amphitrite TaxID=1232801 RepID=A0A6A4VFF7_AMPAM|nr:Sucrase-isomaltase, intestinal [Amphibalanus amphitrite]
MARLWTLLALLGAAVSAPLECPLPDGPDSADEATCGLYSACVWEQGGCRLADRVGYQLLEPPHVIHTGYELLLGRRDSEVTMFGDDVERLTVTAVEYDDNRMALTYRDTDAARYEVPVELDVPPLPTPPPSDPQYAITLTATEAGQTFGVQVTHRQRPVITSRPELIYGDQFIEATFLLGASDLYGFGENNHDSFRHDLEAGVTWPIFAHDHGPGFDVENLYGVHPFFLGIEDDSGSSFGVLILNSNAMEYRLFLLDGVPALTYRTTGGILDLYLFFGDSPLEVLQQYHRTIGLPVMPPYWGLGFQLCRWGYKSVQDIRDVRERMKAAEIPQDVQYSDIDYMDGKRDFTIDPNNFADLPTFIQELREEGVRFVLIYDPAIAADFGTYPTSDRGVEQDVFVKWPNASFIPENQCTGCGQYVAGKVWPDGPTLYPNFFANRTVQWWTDEIRRFRAAAGEPDGFWIDMNEPSSFDTNIGRVSHNSLRGGLQCPHTALDYPPYTTRFVRSGFNPSGTVADHTICMASVHAADLDGTATSYYHYDVHSLYGWSESRATRAAVRATMAGRRSLIVSRSTFVGAGRWATHWTGDNTARWSDMKRSVVGILEFSMFGFPHVGADICGFGGDTSEHLCLRWMQLGAFYPFSRNHNAIENIDQDPAVWPSVAAAARDALGLRYRLLPYLYTLFWRASEMGETVTRPLAFQFPSDPTLRGVDTQFLWGDAVMVAPILDEASMTSVNVTFPAGQWWDLRSGALAYDADHSGGVLYQVALDEMIPVFGRGGAAVPTQRNATTTAASRANPFSLAVFGAQATGMLFWDDGETTDTFKDGSFYHCLFHFSDNTLDIQVTYNDTQWMPDPTLSEISFYGVPSEPSSVSADGVPLRADGVVYEPATGLLTVHTQLGMEADHRVVLNY